MTDFDPFTLPPGFDPFAPAPPPPPAGRAAAGAGPGAARPAPLAALEQRLATAEAAVAPLTARLEAMDTRLTERLNDQMGRLVRTVAEMLAR